MEGEIRTEKNGDGSRTLSWKDEVYRSDMQCECFK